MVCTGLSADRQNIMENSNRTPGLSVRLRPVALGVALIATAAVVHVRVAAQDLSQLVSTSTPAEAAALIYNNRQITVFRAAVLSRTPAERARAASELLDRIVNEGAPGTASSRPLQGVSILSDATANSDQHCVGAAGDGHRRGFGPADAALSPHPG